MTDRPEPTRSRAHDPELWSYWAAVLRRRGLRPEMVEMVYWLGNPTTLHDVIRGTGTKLQVEALNVLWDLQDKTLVSQARVLNRAARQLRTILWAKVAPPLVVIANRLAKVPGLRPRGR